MYGRSLALVGALAAAVGFVSLADAPLGAQGPAASAGSAQAAAWRAPRTAWGHPDLQGVWTNSTTTPLERPKEKGQQEVLSDSEFAELAQQTAQNRFVDRPPPPGNPGAYNAFWFDRGDPTRRTSLIVDPADGRLPALTPEAERATEARAAYRKEHPADTWEDRSLYERCITRGLPGSMMPGFYNHNYQILQTPDYVVILVEMIHDARIIPLDGRPHLTPHIRQWLGDSRGRWEGDTLVIETTNLSERVTDRTVTVFGAGEKMRLIERLTRTDADAIDYRVTVEAPTTFTQPWTAAIPMIRLDAPIFEYACHEGNYGLVNILSGERALERAAAEKK